MYTYQRKFGSLKLRSTDFWKEKKKQSPTIHHHNNTSPQQYMTTEYITITIHHHNKISQQQYITTTLPSDLIDCNVPLCLVI